MDKDLQSRRADALYEQAERDLDAGRLERAQLAVRQAMALQPGTPKAHRLVSQIYTRMGKPVLAEKAAAAAAALESGPASAARAFQPPPEPAEVELTALQRRALLDASMRLLTRVTATESRLREVGGESEALAVWSESRERLQRVAQRARDAWRGGTGALPDGPGVAAADAPPPAEIAPEYRAIPAFTRTLGAAAGAVTRGPEVVYLQQLLGLEGLRVPITGNYDGSTAVAVGELQKRYGLRKQDGLVSVETRQLLNRLTGKGNALPIAPPAQAGARVNEQTRAVFSRLAERRAATPEGGSSC